MLTNKVMNDGDRMNSVINRRMEMNFYGEVGVGINRLGSVFAKSLTQTNPIGS